MTIELNGENHEVPAGATVHDLIEALELAGQRVAVLLDGDVVRRSDFAQARLEPDSKVEVVHMVGGG